MKPKSLTPLKAIRARCLECVGNKPSLVKRCDSTDCALYVYRFGRNPNRTGIGGNISAQKTCTLPRIASSASDSEANSINSGITTGLDKKVDLEANKAKIGSGTSKLSKIQKLADEIISLAKDK